VNPKGDPLAVALRQFGLARDRLWAVLARSSRIGTTDLTALEMIDVLGPLSQRELGHRLGLTPGAVTMLVDRLERAGWVERYPHSSDRRYRLVDLAHESIDAMPSGFAAYYETMQILARHVQAGDRAALISFLHDAAFATDSVATSFP
jgi:DNA-binding MarR family transcriptional regulator